MNFGRPKFGRPMRSGVFMPRTPKCKAFSNNIAPRSSRPYIPPIVGGKPLSPVHYSRQNSVHADHGFRPHKTHIPFSGQTTLPTFRVGGLPGAKNDRNLARIGGTFRPPKSKKRF